MVKLDFNSLAFLGIITLGDSMKKLTIIYEDKDIIVVDKRAGILSISDGKSNNTLYSQVRDYLHKKNQKVFIVHRLDKYTSGVILFAKSEKLRDYLQENWNELCILREYVAMVEGNFKKREDKLINYLKESKTLEVYVTSDKINGKKAITNYEVIKENEKYSMLRVWIETGRKNQIRAQLANINHPIVGDKKYKARSNPIKRLGLHASKLIINIKGKEMEFIAKIPKCFEILDN